MDAKKLELEKKCDACDAGLAYGSRCHVCKGTGFVATEDGKRILNFVCRHIQQSLD